MLIPELIKRGTIHGTQFVSLEHFSIFGVVFVLLGSLVLPGKNELRRIAIAGLLGAAAANGLFTLAWWPAFDVKLAANLLAHAQAQGRPIAAMPP